MVGKGPPEALTKAAKSLGAEIEAMRRALAALAGVRPAAERVPPGLLAFRSRPNGDVKSSRAATSHVIRVPVSCARNALITIVASAEDVIEHRLTEAKRELAMTEARLQLVEQQITELEQGKRRAA